MTPPHTSLHAALSARFADAREIEDDTGPEILSAMAARGSCRRFEDREVPGEVLDLLCALALSGPSKSDLQQRDIIVLRSKAVRARLADLVGGQAWVAEAPMLLVFCGNNRRQRILHKIHDIPFANDHFDALFNAIGDAALALGGFVTAAEAMGLGCCPISAVRNEAEAVSDLLALPDHVFPFAGLALGYPAGPGEISPRLPLRLTVHEDRYGEDALEEEIRAYDAAREAVQPYGVQRFSEEHGPADNYGWSLDKARQYSRRERAGFGAFLRAKGFRFD